MSVPTNPLSYNQYVTQLALLATYQVQEVGGVVQGVDPSFTAIIPQTLNYAELRIQRDLELLAAQSQASVGTLTPANPLFNVPLDTFYILQNILVSIGGIATPLLPTSKEWIQNVYPAGSPVAPPQYFCILNGGGSGDGQTTIMLGPPPDQNYGVTGVGILRIPSLAQNASAGIADTNYTFISEWLPDLLLMASMIFVSLYQRNFSRAADDPQMAVSYESQYGALLSSANKDEFRRRFEADAWSSMASSQVATENRAG